MQQRDEQYLRYLDRHRAFVLEEANKLDVHSRGLAHDLSKYTPAEFDSYAEYFYGGHERGSVPVSVQEAFDRAWLAHQKSNDHHYQFWLLHEDSGALKTLAMTQDALREMLADWRGAGRAILGDKADTAAWYRKNRDHILLHPDSRLWIEKQLGLL